MRLMEKNKYTNIQSVLNLSQAAPYTNLLISRTVEGPSREIVIMFLGKNKPRLDHGGTQDSFSALELTAQPDGRSWE